MTGFLIVALIVQFSLRQLRAVRVLALGRADQRRRHPLLRQPRRQLRHRRCRRRPSRSRSRWPSSSRSGTASERTLSIHSIVTTRREAFYWLAVLFTFALGTSAGDLTAERLAVGYWQSAVLFGGAHRRDLHRARPLRRERDPDVLDRLHPDASARRLDRRLPLAAHGRRGPRPRHHGHEHPLPRRHPRRRRLPLDHEGGQDRARLGAQGTSCVRGGGPEPTAARQRARDRGRRRSRLSSERCVVNRSGRRSRLRLDDARLVRRDHELHAIARAELAEDARDVGLLRAGSSSGSGA